MSPSRKYQAVAGGKNEILHSSGLTLQERVEDLSYNSISHNTVTFLNIYFFTNPKAVGVCFRCQKCNCPFRSSLWRYCIRLIIMMNTCGQIVVSNQVSRPITIERGPLLVPLNSNTASTSAVLFIVIPPRGMNVIVPSPASLKTLSCSHGGPCLPAYLYMPYFL